MQHHKTHTCKNTSIAFRSSLANHCAGLSTGGAASAPVGDEGAVAPSEARRGGDSDALLESPARPLGGDDAGAGAANTAPSVTVPRSSITEGDVDREKSGWCCISLSCFMLSSRDIAVRSPLVRAVGVPCGSTGERERLLPSAVCGDFFGRGSCAVSWIGSVRFRCSFFGLVPILALRVD